MLLPVISLSTTASREGPRAGTLSLVRWLAVSVFVALVTRPGLAEAHEIGERDHVVELDVNWGASALVLEPSASWGVRGGYRLLDFPSFVFLSYSRQGSYGVAGDQIAEPYSASLQHHLLGISFEKDVNALNFNAAVSVGASRMIVDAGDAHVDDLWFSFAPEFGFKFRMNRWAHLRILGRLPVMPAMDDISPPFQFEGRAGLGARF